MDTKIRGGCVMDNISTLRDSSTSTLAVRAKARNLVIEQVSAAARKEHERNYEKLHVNRDGSVNWSESINRSDDIIDRFADPFAAVPSVCCVGTGSQLCNCDYCEMVYDKDVEDSRVALALGALYDSSDPDITHADKDRASIRAAYLATAYQSQDNAIVDAVANSDTEQLEESMLEAFDAIEMGYFEDED